MCGIFGVIGQDNNASQKVFKGLLDIEYRGYDSWGIAGWKLEDRIWKVEKKVGFLPKEISLPSATLALGHTRWATHGGVTEENAHPHLSCNGKVVLVHNGIVENYSELKKKLSGHRIKSQTDSEILAHLIEDEIKDRDLKNAVSNIFKKIKGLNALVVSNGEEIVACKIGSPLVLGKTADSFIVASDPNAILPYTNRLIFMEDNQLAVLNDSFKLLDALSLKEIKAEFIKIDWEYQSEKRSEFPHLMLKEIHEQPQVLYNQIQDLTSFEVLAEEIKKAYGTYFIGCGSAAYACILGEYLFSKIAGVHVNFSLGSEFKYTADFLTDKSLLIAVSQSGETIDVLEPVAYAKKKGVKIAVLTNTLGSSLYRMADIKILLQAGPEKAVASTKALIAMVSDIILLSYARSGRLEDGVEVIQNSVSEIEEILKRQGEIKRIAQKIYKSEHMFILGRGLSYPVALESALKIKEVSYIHAEGLASGELKHGPIALIDKKTPVMVFVPNDETKDATLANAMEVKSRGAYVIGVGVENNEVFDFFFQVQDTGASSVLPHIVFSQLLGYYLAIKLGRNPDKPRNLAKSVTVR